MVQSNAENPLKKPSKTNVFLIANLRCFLHLLENRRIKWLGRCRNHSKKKSSELKDARNARVRWKKSRGKNRKLQTKPGKKWKYSVDLTIWRSLWPFFFGIQGKYKQNAFKVPFRRTTYESGVGGKATGSNPARSFHWRCQNGSGERRGWNFRYINIISI